MKKKSVFMGMIAISALVWMTGCAGRAVESSDIETEQEEKDGSGETETDVISIDGDKLKVMASFYPMYDFAQKIGGDRVEVTNMVPAGTEPHDWNRQLLTSRSWKRQIFLYTTEPEWSTGLPMCLRRWTIKT